MTAADREQLAGYIATASMTGNVYRAGNPSDLVQYQPGGVLAGVIYDGAGVFSREYEVRLYPGPEGSGLFYYALKPTGRTRMNNFTDNVSNLANDLLKELAKPRCWVCGWAPGSGGGRDPQPSYP